MYRKYVCLAALCLTLALGANAGAQLGQGKVLFEYWDNIGGGTSVDNDLRTNANFPNNPSSSVWLDKFQSPSGRADNYGVRGRAFITPPQTGDYTFWVAGDDNCQLWLSTDDNPANATMIAQVASWTGVAEWGKEAGQKSAPQALVAGQKYYLEGLMKEGGGGDSLDVGWAGPGIGDAATVIAGQYCTAFIRNPEPLLQAQSPKPADKAVDVTSPLFEWTPGAAAAMHDIYFGETADLGAADYKGPMPVAMYYHMLPLEAGKTYYWRIDEIDAAGAKTVGKVWSFTVMPMTAHAPTPADAAKDLAVLPTLSWTAGQNAMGHIVYLGKDKAAVTAGDAAAQAGTITETSFTPAAALDAFSTYYWRVDEVDMTGTISAGPVWSFSTVTYVPIFEAQQALNYSNAVAPFLTSLDANTPADLTGGGKCTDLAIRFLGRAGPTGGLTYDEATTTYSLAGAGADIWGNSDQFHYAYKTLDGDGTMVARVVTVGTGTSEWAKGGVMIRQSLAANSTHAFMPITGPSATVASGGNGASFQRRLATAGASSNNDAGTRVAAPYWVKIERKGDAFTGSISPDGVTWTQLGDAQTIAMGNPVYIGLAVTSHVAGALRTFTFDNVATTGNVTPDGPFAAWDDIGIASNDPAPITVTLRDAAGAVAAVTHPNPAASQVAVWDLWRVPLSAFTGVDAKQAAKLVLSVGDGNAGGSGVVTFADVRTVQPATLPAEGAIDVTMPTDALIAEPNDGDWPAAELPAKAIDDDILTKFLHFKGEIQPTGIIVTPAIGRTVVTGLTFTTANDAAERDPAAFELYGSNKGTAGPWALIAKGNIDDFTRPLAWPRRWKNVTPIGFANTVAYANYKVLVTAVRTKTSANSMQVAEIELLGTVAEGTGPVVAWVTFHAADNAPTKGATDAGLTEAPDKGYTDLLAANGYTVMRIVQTGTPNVEALKAAADLVIVSRSVASGSFSNAAADTWNNVPLPMIIMNGYLTRKSRLGFNTNSNLPDTTGDIKLTVTDATHPIFAGVALTDGTMNNPFAAGALQYPDGVAFRGISVVTDPPVAGGIILAKLAEASGSVTAGSMIIGEFPAGTQVIHDGGAGTDTLPAARLVFLSGAREASSGKSSETAGMYDLYDDGAKLFLNAVDYMIP